MFYKVCVPFTAILPRVALIIMFLSTDLLSFASLGTSILGIMFLPFALFWVAVSQKIVIFPPEFLSILFIAFCLDALGYISLFKLLPKGKARQKEA